MTMKNFPSLVPHRDLRTILAGVEKPGRYVGGEYGAVDKLPDPEDYGICVVFPDLYEIAMSNQAVRILYKLFNDCPGLHAERAFSPANDFRDALKQAGIPMYSLENGLPVAEFDMLAITIGYELSFTNLLSFLDSSGIPLRAEDREDGFPLLVAGGPAMTNPAPWASYLDGVFIGEAEGHILPTLMKLRDCRNAGGTLSDQRSILHADESIWSAGSPTARRSMWPGFGQESGVPAALPIPSMPPVQDHGVVEIMRGCPNKCRFCHAGVFYRPFRQKKAGRILEEVAYLVDECGYRDITLSSLSTGDYSGLEPLVEALNRLYAHRKVSFSLPSLRVNSVTLTLIGNLGSVRKSGLTFAVETPTLEGQRGINKEVPADRVIAILKEAKSKGWKLAKFYFMLGLPVGGHGDEEQTVVDYLLNIQKETGMNLNVNLGTFIPKAHTPFERAPQLTDEVAISRIRTIRDGLKVNRKIRFSFHSPFVSYLEGILSRGDKRAGELAQKAWEYGAGFDAWDDRMDKDAWRKAISEADWDVEETSCRARNAEEELPWDGVSLGVTARHLAAESRRSRDAELTVPCALLCTDHCGVCDRDCRVKLAETDEILRLVSEVGQEEAEEPEWQRLLLNFSKSGPAIYLGHLDMMNVFEKSLQRAGIQIDFTRGFNPKPRIEFAQPLSLGLYSRGEIATIRTIRGSSSAEELAARLRKALPEGLDILEASWIAPVQPGRKTIKVMGAFWGSEWLLDLEEDLSGPGQKNATKLAESIQEICRKNGISDDLEIMEILQEPSEGIRLRLRHGGTRHHNLMRILEAISGQSVLAGPWVITRMQSLAKDSEGNPRPFREVFAE